MNSCALLLGGALLTGACLTPESTTSSDSDGSSGATGGSTGASATATGTGPTTTVDPTAASATDTAGETEGTSGGGMEPTTGTGIDPTAEDELLFQKALALYNAADYTGADPLFTQLWDTYPDSPRRDNAGYLHGRCLYAAARLRRRGPGDAAVDHRLSGVDLRRRIAVLLGPRAVPPGTFARAPSTHFDASVKADAAGTYVDNAYYYGGRTKFEQGDYAAAEAVLASFEAKYPASTYADNAAYYLGRARFSAGDQAGAKLALDPRARLRRLDLPRQRDLLPRPLGVLAGGPARRAHLVQGRRQQVSRAASTRTTRSTTRCGSTSIRSIARPPTPCSPTLTDALPRRDLHRPGPGLRPRGRVLIPDALALDRAARPRWLAGEPRRSPCCRRSPWRRHRRRR
jgi:TolA-binding protein